MIYDIGDKPRLSVTFTLDDVPTAPTTISFSMTEPDGTITTYTEPSSEIQNPSTGVYYVDWTVDQAGDHRWKFTGTGTVTSSEYGWFVAEGTLTDYPGGPSLAQFMLDEDLIASEPGRLNRYDAEMAAAIEWLERETWYKPFLEGTSASFVYDPPGPNRNGLWRGGDRYLFLRKGFTDITEVLYGVTTDFAGTELDVDKDFYLRPSNHATDGVPITAIEFVRPQSGPPNSIKITGTPGYSDVLPADVREALLKYAAGQMLRSRREQFATEPVEWKEDDVSERKSIELIEKLGDAYIMQARSIILSKYKLWA